ncbi:hypothetical protein PENFLA_c001G10370 [Penicillium flavigenum]|uniref:Uncharacterized protein n=1 Tax=Penicillium flavigenum TaxID=254877 RepID=A0A1V6U3H4_9EURO|nr:hypothetical protein PENFLA_c001G10370 [Penicillium flavigenum]
MAFPNRLFTPSTWRFIGLGLSTTVLSLGGLAILSPSLAAGSLGVNPTTPEGRDITDKAMIFLGIRDVAVAGALFLFYSEGKEKEMGVILTAWTAQALAPPDLPAANPGILLSKANTADTSTTDQSPTDLFKDVLHDTQSPALALQALITRGTQAAYYEHLMREDPTASALTAFSSTALIPVRWDGFVAGVSIIVVHFIILAVITVLFVIYTMNSMIGNSWQAVAQVVSEDMLPVLDQALPFDIGRMGAWLLKSVKERLYNTCVGYDGVDLAEDGNRRFQACR